MVEYTEIPDEYRNYSKRFADKDVIKKEFDGDIEKACESHPAFFAYWLIGLKMRDYQVYMLDQMQKNKKVMFVCGRRLGKTSVMMIFDAWAMFYNKFPTGLDKTTKIIFIAQTDDSSKDYIRDVREIFSAGDSRCELVLKKKRYFTSKISKKSDSAPSNANQLSMYNKGWNTLRAYPPTQRARGKSASVFHCDEIAFWESYADPDEETVYREVIRPVITDNPNSRIYLATTPNGHCYDSQTEVYTENGWKLFKDVQDDELIYSRNQETGIAELVPIEDRVDQPYNGNMIKLKSNNIDLVVTPGHRMIGYYQKSKKRTIVSAENLLKTKTDFLIDKEFKHRVSKITHVTIPEISYTTGNGIHTKKSYDVDAPLFYKWLGYIMSDGHITNNTVSFTQNPNSFLDEFELLSKKIFSHINVIKQNHEKAFRINLNNKQLADFIRAFKKEGIPKHILHVQTSLLQELWQGFWNGDGARSENRPRVYNDIKYKKLNDSIWYVANRVGGSAKITNYPNKGLTHITKSNFTKCKIKTYTDQLTTIDYHDRIYCFTVKYGELYVRRNGRAVWCGNTGLSYELMPVDNHPKIFNLIWFPYYIRQDEDYIKGIEEMRELEYKPQGKMDAFRQEYLAELVVKSDAYFIDKEVDNVFKDTSLQFHPYSNLPVEVAIDFGGSKNSHTVIGISHLDNDNNIIRVYHKRYDIGNDSTLKEDILALGLIFTNIQRWHIDSQGGGSSFYGWFTKIFGSTMVDEVNFKAEKAGMYRQFKIACYQGRIKSYHDQDLMDEMNAFTRDLKPSKGATDDMLDVFVMSCRDWLKQEEKSIYNVLLY